MELISLCILRVVFSTFVFLLQFSIHNQSGSRTTNFTFIAIRKQTFSSLASSRPQLQNYRFKKYITSLHLHLPSFLQIKFRLFFLSFITVLKKNGHETGKIIERYKSKWQWDSTSLLLTWRSSNRQ